MLSSLLLTLISLPLIPAEHILFNAQHPFLHSTDDTPSTTSAHYALAARPTTVFRPKDLAAVDRARLRSLHYAETVPVEWYPKQVHGPDIEDRHTLDQLARMAGNAYALPGHSNWYDLDPAWNISFPFGWEDHADGFRGHVFLSADNSTVVLAIKGTTLQGTTSKKDKFNDNLLFSCCCARVDFSWVFRTVCDCYAKNWRCDDRCLTDALIQDSLFYSTGVRLVMDLVFMYPTANIWLVGHSLGGSLASLLGATYGYPAVAFEAPGERLAATRLHIPLPPPLPDHHSNIPLRTAPLPVTHVYHTADPIPQGACTGPFSACAQGGYALETRCHLGKSIVYDSVNVLGWRVDVRKHIIREVIEGVIGYEGGWPERSDEDEDEREEDIREFGWFHWLKRGWWGRGDKDKDKDKDKPKPPPMLDVPRAEEEVDCQDCYKWEFGPFKDVPDSPDTPEDSDS